jgi:hypothetical protein
VDDGGGHALAGSLLVDGVADVGQRALAGFDDDIEGSAAAHLEGQFAVTDHGASGDRR